MKRLPVLAETIGLYAGAIFIIAAIRLNENGIGTQAWWLVPFVWIATACLPVLWTDEHRITSMTLFGRVGAGLAEAARLGLIVFPVFALAYWAAFGTSLPPPGGFRWTPGVWNTIFFQVVYVGLSEELFFRGYLQPRFDGLFGRPFKLFGARWGYGLFLANFLFAAGHSLVSGRWANLDVFFPGLLFGWLKAKTGAVLAPVLFHGLSNVLLITLRSWTTV